MANVDLTRLQYTMVCTGPLPVLLPLLDPIRKQFITNPLVVEIVHNFIINHWLLFVMPMACPLCNASYFYGSFEMTFELGSIDSLFFILKRSLRWTSD